MVMNSIKQSARQAGAKRLGEILLGAGFINEEELEAALALSQEQDRRLGEVMVEMGLITSLMLKASLQEQLKVRSEEELIGQLEASIGVEAAGTEVEAVPMARPRSIAEGLSHGFRVLADNALAVAEQASLRAMPILPVLSARVAPEAIPQGERSAVLFTVSVGHQGHLPIRNAILGGNGFPQWIRIQGVGINGTSTQFTEQGELVLGDIAPRAEVKVAIGAQASPSTIGGHLHSFRLRSDNARAVSAEAALVVTSPVKTVLGLKAEVSPASIHEGENTKVVCTLIVKNQGRVKAKGLVLRDDGSPEWLTLRGVSVGGVAQNHLLGEADLCLPDIEPGGSLAVSVEAEGVPLATGEGRMSFVVGAQNAYEANAGASFTVAMPLKTALSLERTISPDLLPQNEEVPATITLIVRNAGSIPARKVHLRGKEKPSWLAIQEAKVDSGIIPPFLLWDEGVFLGDIPAKSGKVIPISVMVGPAEAGEYSLSFEAQATNAETAEGNWPITISGQVKALLRVEKKVLPEITPEGEATPVTYSVTLYNEGRVPARNVVISESSFPDWFQVSDIAVDGVVLATAFPPDGGLALGEIAAGEALEVTISGIANPPVAAETRGEFEMLGEAFNAVVEELQVTLAEVEERTHELEAERERRLAFVSDVAHNLRDLIAPLQLTDQLLPRWEQLSPELRQDVMGTFHNQVQLLNSCVADLLDTSHIEAGRFTLDRRPTELAAMARRVAEELQATTTTHQILLEAPERLEGNWDPDRLSQVLINLVGNAIKYSSEGGEVRVRIEERESQAQVCIRDQGTGVPAEGMPGLFEPHSYRYQEGQREGLGLDLYICRGIIEAHGGHIWCESQGPGQGSTFCFSLPLGD